MADGTWLYRPRYLLMYVCPLSSSLQIIPGSALTRLQSAATRQAQRLRPMWIIAMYSWSVWMTRVQKQMIPSSYSDKHWRLETDHRLVTKETRHQPFLPPMSLPIDLPIPPSRICLPFPCVPCLTRPSFYPARLPELHQNQRAV